MSPARHAPAPAAVVTTVMAGDSQVLLINGGRLLARLTSASGHAIALAPGGTPGPEPGTRTAT